MATVGATLPTVIVVVETLLTLPLLSRTRNAATRVPSRPSMPAGV